MRDNVQRMRELVRNQNTLRLEVFGSAQAIAYVAKALAFAACVFVVPSSFLKVLDMHKIIRDRTRSKLLQCKARTLPVVRTFHNALSTRKSDARFFQIN